jgi:hypothetical protein
MRKNGAYRPIHFTHAERCLKSTRKAMTVRVMPFSKWRVKVVKRTQVDARAITFFEHKRYFVRVTKGLREYQNTSRKYKFSMSTRRY